MRSTDRPCFLAIHPLCVLARRESSSDDDDDASESSSNSSSSSSSSSSELPPIQPLPPQALPEFYTKESAKRRGEAPAEPPPLKRRAPAADGEPAARKKRKKARSGAGDGAGEEAQAAEGGAGGAGDAAAVAAAAPADASRPRCDVCRLIFTSPAQLVEHTQARRARGAGCAGRTLRMLPCVCCVAHRRR
jgi:hypothetical protein